MPSSLFRIYPTDQDKFLSGPVRVTGAWGMGNSCQFMHARPSNMLSRVNLTGNVLPSSFQRQYNGNKHGSMPRPLWGAVVEWIRSNKQFMCARPGNVFGVNAG